MELTIGMKGTVSTLAERQDTALEVGSGDLLVYATPCMAALMEGAACEAIAPALSEGQTSVGIALDLAHTSATPLAWRSAQRRRSRISPERSSHSKSPPSTKPEKSAAAPTSGPWSTPSGF